MHASSTPSFSCFQSLEPLFEEKLLSEQNVIASKAQAGVHDALNQFREPKESIQEVVRPYMEMFDQTCEGN
jgi:hypothetical protein